jgi:hypothetical protein
MPERHDLCMHDPARDRSDHPGGNVIPLVKMVVAIDDDPTLEQVDEILTELQRMPRDHRVIGLIDDLLDYRAFLAA